MPIKKQQNKFFSENLFPFITRSVHFKYCHSASVLSYGIANDLSHIVSTEDVSSSVFMVVRCIFVIKNAIMLIDRAKEQIANDLKRRIVQIPHA